MIEATAFKSPIGRVTVGTHEDRLCALAFGAAWATVARSLERRFRDADIRSSKADPLSLGGRVEDYFEGDLQAFDDVTLEVPGTPFQQRVWNALREVAAGETVTYSDVARRVGSAAAVRAVGSASGANAVCIVIPCHRMLRSDGSVGGYGGGLDRKTWLLEHERRYRET